MTSVPSTTYLIPVGEADVPRMNTMNSIFDVYSIKWILTDRVFQKNISLLEVGCGNGELTMKLAKELGEKIKIVAIDRSEEQIKLARENSEKLGIKNVTWIVKDAYQLKELESEYKDGFDIVHCRFLLSHLKKPAEVVKHMASMVSKNGSLIMEELAGHHYQCLPSEPFCMKVWRWAISLEHFIQGSDLSTGSRLSKIVNELGMKNIQVAKPGPIAAQQEQKALFALSLGGLMAAHIHRLFHFLIKPWVRALQRLENDPNYSVRFIDFIQVHATKDAS